MNTLPTATPEQLFHYTTPAGALGIIDSGEVWATMIHYMNDSQEFRYALDLARSLIVEMDGVSEQVRRLVADEFLRTVRSVAVFVFSLTERNDLLSQWRAYSSSRGGYSLGFSRDVLGGITAEDSAILVRCVYDRDSQVALLKPVLHEMLEAASAMPIDAHGIELYRTFAEQFTAAAATIKHPSFDEEREWRLIFGPGVDPARTGARTGGGLVIPYYRCSIRRGGKYPISTIVVGPSPNADLAARSLRYVTTNQFGWPAKITFSQSPFRPLD